MKIQSFQLPNKLKVFLLENHKAPVVTIQSWVRTGSADEQKGQEGLSHFIEHLLFKGTKKFKMGEIAQIIEGAGGDLNAYTSFDQTVFYMTLSSHYVDLGLEAMSEMMGAPLFDKKEIDAEREVVIEEIKRSTDNPSRRSSQLLFNSIYSEHAYRRPVIGYTNIVKKSSPEKIKKLFTERYCPENMFLLVVGDFSAQEMKEKIKKNFSFLKGKLRNVKRTQEKNKITTKILLEKANFQESLLNLAWPTFAASEEEKIALDLLSYILANGDNTRLIQSLRIQKPIVNEIGAFEFAAKDPGFFSITSHFALENLNDILTNIANEILFLLAEEVSEEEISKAVIQIESSQHYQETMDSYARQIGSDQFMYNNPLHFLKYLKQLKKIRARHLNKVVRKFLNPKNLRISMVQPLAEPSPQKEINLWVSDFITGFESFEKQKATKVNSTKEKNFLATPKKLKTPSRPEKFNTKSGAKIIFHPLPETGVISVRAGFLGGLRADIAHKEGGFELLSRLWATETQNKTEDQIAEILETKNASIHSFSGRNSFGLQAFCLNSAEKEIGNLFQEILLKPTFSDSQFDREKEVLKRHLDNLIDHPSSLVFDDFLQNMFEGHPYANETYGTSGSVADLQATDLRTLYGKYVGGANMTLVIAGGMDVNYWRECIQALDSQMPIRERFEKKFETKKINQAVRKFRESKKEQSHIVYGFRGLTIFDEEKFALQTLQTILSGQGGNLFINLRDKASLAYSVSPVRMDGIETGYFGAYIGCSPEKGAKSIEMLKIEFDKMAEKKCSKLEIERAQKNIIGKQDIGLQKTTNVTANILFDEIYGIKHLGQNEFREKIMSISADDVLRLSQKIFRQEPVIACVGAICPW